MRPVRFILNVAVLLGFAFAQSSESNSSKKTVFLLRDDLHQQWCGYASESLFKLQIQSLKALVVGGADYADGHLSMVRVTETDETGDWAVNDEYIFDKAGRIRTLKRKINILPEDTSEEQMFVIENGKAIKQRSTYHELGTRKATQKRVDWFEASPVITDVEAFPFAPLIGSKRFNVWSQGEACIDVKQP